MANKRQKSLKSVLLAAKDWDEIAQILADWIENGTPAMKMCAMGHWLAHAEGLPIKRVEQTVVSVEGKPELEAMAKNPNFAKHLQRLNRRVQGQLGDRSGQGKN